MFHFVLFIGYGNSLLEEQVKHICACLFNVADDKYEPCERYCGLEYIQPEWFLLHWFIELKEGSGLLLIRIPDNKIKGTAALLTITGWLPLIESLR
jgi:hypothetical protein